jgi:hypothetical protein
VTDRLGDEEQMAAALAAINLYLDFGQDRPRRQELTRWVEVARLEAQRGSSGRSSVNPGWGRRHVR